jgi:hypothetical protein
MPVESVWCHVLGTNITRVTDFEGVTTRLICPEYDEADGLCRLRMRTRGGGPLSQFLDRVIENDIAERSTRCELS